MTDLSTFVVIRIYHQKKQTAMGNNGHFLDLIKKFIPGSIFGTTQTTVNYRYEAPRHAGSQALNGPLSHSFSYLDKHVTKL